jgi:hypothetical protein
MHRNSDGDLHTHYTAPDEYGLEETSGQQHLESASPGQNAKQSATPSTDVSFEHLEMLLERLEESARQGDDAAHFLKRRAEIEEVYAKSLRRLYEETAEAKVVSLRALKNKLTRGATGAEGHNVLAESTTRAWGAITAETLQASQLHQGCVICSVALCLCREMHTHTNPTRSSTTPSLPTTYPSILMNSTPYPSILPRHSTVGAPSKRNSSATGQVCCNCPTPPQGVAL